VHILTVGEYTYATDERFAARHNRDTGEWVLVIKYAQERDAGGYECQIPSAQPQSYKVNLNIVGECRAPMFLAVFSGKYVYIMVAAVIRHVDDAEMKRDESCLAKISTLVTDRLLGYKHPSHEA